MLPSEAGPGMMRDPFVRFFMRLEEIHKTTPDYLCGRCGDPAPCDTMRALWVYDMDTRAARGGLL